MARRAPTGRPAWSQGWIYALCLDPPYPNPPTDNGHQVGHYSGISRNGLEARLATHAEGGIGAARLLQVQKAAGGTFHLVSVEWGTQDTETARKYRGATWRCGRCKASPPAPGEAPADVGWVCIVHLDPPHQAAGPGPEAAQPAHRAVFIADTKSMYAALGRGGRDVAGLVDLPEASGGTWRLVSAKWGAPDRAARTAPQAALACPVCRAAKEEARADELLVAIWRGEVADRFFALAGSWAARWYTRNGQPIVSARPGGHLGHNVTLTVAALVRRGLAKQVPAPPADAGEQAKLADRPYQLTRDGQVALPRARARRLRAAGLPVTRTGRLCLPKMTDQQRDKAGLMTRAMAREHNALRNLDGDALPGPLCAGASRPDIDEDCVHDSCGDILRGQRPPRRSQRIREMAPADEWTTPGPPPTQVLALEVAVTGQTNGRSLGAAADPSWPSTVTDGIRAAVNGGGGPGRRAGSSRRAALAITRGAAR
jgi:hypothetical protein